MRRFIATVFDEWVYDVPAYTSDMYQELLGSCDRLSIQAITDAVTGSGVRLAVTIETTSDGIRWNALAVVISGAPLGSAQTNVAFGSTSASLLGMARARLRVELAGSDQQARVRLIVCGRDTARKNGARLNDGWSLPVLGGGGRLGNGVPRMATGPGATAMAWFDGFDGIPNPARRVTAGDKLIGQVDTTASGAEKPCKCAAELRANSMEPSSGPGHLDTRVNLRDGDCPCSKTASFDPNVGLVTEVPAGKGRPCGCGPSEEDTGRPSVLSTRLGAPRSNRAHEIATLTANTRPASLRKRSFLDAALSSKGFVGGGAMLMTEGYAWRASHVSAHMAEQQVQRAVAWLDHSFSASSARLPVTEWLGATLPREPEVHPLRSSGGYRGASYWEWSQWVTGALHCLFTCPKDGFHDCCPHPYEGIKCAYLYDDPINCGKCGHVCKWGYHCKSGLCWKTCSSHSDCPEPAFCDPGWGPTNPPPNSNLGGCLKDHQCTLDSHCVVPGTKCCPTGSMNIKTCVNAEGLLNCGDCGVVADCSTAPFTDCIAVGCCKHKTGSPSLVVARTPSDEDDQVNRKYCACQDPGNKNWIMLADAGPVPCPCEFLGGFCNAFGDCCSNNCDIPNQVCLPSP